MQWLVSVVITLILCFGFVLLFGPPYLPTLTKQARLAIEMINLKPGETLLELGCGDGKILSAAAATGVYAVGYELNPILVLIARFRTWRHRKYVRVVWGNLWDTDKWPEAEGIFTFLLPRQMQRLDDEIAAWHKKPVKLVSFAFPLPNRQPVQQDNGVYLYEYR